MARFLSIDPGLSNSGLVLFNTSPKEVLATYTIKGHPVKNDQHLVRIRGRVICSEIDAFLALHPVEFIVIEGYITFSSRQNAYSWQTPYICGVLHEHLKNYPITIQTSCEVLRRGSPERHALALLQEGKRVCEGAEKVTNEHLRSAFAHGLYYMRKHHARR